MCRDGLYREVRQALMVNGLIAQTIAMPLSRTTWRTGLGKLLPALIGTVFWLATAALGVLRMAAGALTCCLRSTRWHELSGHSDQDAIPAEGCTGKAEDSL